MAKIEEVFNDATRTGHDVDKDGHNKCNELMADFNALHKKINDMVPDCHKKLGGIDLFAMAETAVLEAIVESYPMVYPTVAPTTEAVANTLEDIKTKK